MKVIHVASDYFSALVFIERYGHQEFVQVCMWSTQKHRSAYFKGLLHLHLFTSMLIGAYLCVHMCKYMQVLFRVQLGFLNSWGVKTSPHKGESAGTRANLAQHATSWADLNEI